MIVPIGAVCTYTVFAAGVFTVCKTAVKTSFAVFTEIVTVKTISAFLTNMIYICIVGAFNAYSVFTAGGYAHAQTAFAAKSAVFA